MSSRSVSKRTRRLLESYRAGRVPSLTFTAGRRAGKSNMAMMHLRALASLPKWARREAYRLIQQAHDSKPSPPV